VGGNYVINNYHPQGQNCEACVNIEPSHGGDSTTSQTIESNVFFNERIPNKIEISMQA
jgi:hypothetical protein